MNKKELYKQYLEIRRKFRSSYLDYAWNKKITAVEFGGKLSEIASSITGLSEEIQKEHEEEIVK
ncbi:MAG: hypothetical protein AABY15_08500 [Nanoarchaeota archaeon]